MKLTLLLIGLCLCGAVARADHGLCGGIVIKDGRLHLDKNEKTLVCGNDSAESWRSVPLPQAEYQLRVILQNRGYHECRFERDGERLNVWMGPVQRSRQLILQGAAGLLRAEKKRKVIGYPLEPKKLDEVSQWAEAGLRQQGFACAALDLSAEAWSGTVHLNVTPNGRRTIDRVERSGLEGLDREAVAQRFEAFHSGETYNVINTQITANRMLAEGLFQSAYFSTICHDGDKVDLRLFAGQGPSRLVRFRFGASTEELPFGEIWFKDTKLDERASNYTAVLHASPIRQSLDLNSELYHVPFSKRMFFGPRFTVEHRKERAYALNRAAAGVDLGRAWDSRSARFEGRVGPTLTYEKTVSGIGPGDAKFASWQGTINVMSHTYEAFMTNQYEGWNGFFKYQGQREGVGSPINVDRYDALFKYLWNLGAYSPPLFVFATRIEGSAVDSKHLDTPVERDLLPNDYRIFYGGQDNMRGFARQSLDNAGRGYLSALHAGFELRLIEEIPYHIEPFLLFDAARLGARRYTLDDPLFTSTGVGVRWPSPFGTLRGSAARGRIFHGNASTDGYRQQWVFFVSFGQEF